MSCRRSSSGSPLGILEVNSGGMESCCELAGAGAGEGEVFTVFAKLRGTRPAPAPGPGSGEAAGAGAGEASWGRGERELSLRRPGDSLGSPASLGVWPGVWLRGPGVSDLWVGLGEAGSCAQGKGAAPAPARRDCSRLRRQEATISSLRAPKPGTAGWAQPGHGALVTVEHYLQRGAS